jgi:hypothetical protein
LEERAVGADGEPRLVRADNELLREERARLAADGSAISTLLLKRDELGDVRAAVATDTARRQVRWLEREARRG